MPAMKTIPKHQPQSTTVPDDEVNRRPTPPSQPVSSQIVDSKIPSQSLDVAKVTLKNGEDCRSFHVTDNVSQAPLSCQPLGPGPARQIVHALDTLRERHDVPSSISVDNGREFASQWLADLAISAGIELLVIGHLRRTASPSLNGCIANALVPRSLEVSTHRRRLEQVISGGGFIADGNCDRMHDGTVD